MVNFNGALLPDTALFLNHTNRAFRYGDALIETIRVVAGVPVFWEDHYFRLMASMRMLRMEIPMNFTMGFLEEQFGGLLAANEMQTGSALIRMTVFREGLGGYLPGDRAVSFCMEAQKLGSDRYRLGEASYEVELFRDYFVNPDMLSNLDTTTKVVKVLGSIYAYENGYDGCLLLNQQKQVVEALTGNLFIVNGNTIKTPPLKDGCTKGIIREKIITVLKGSTEFDFEEVSISPFELQKADELFVADIGNGIRAITKYRKKVFGNSVAKRVLEKLNALAEEGSRG